MDKNKPITKKLLKSSAFALKVAVAISCSIVIITVYSYSRENFRISDNKFNTFLTSISTESKNQVFNYFAKPSATRKTPKTTAIPSSTQHSTTKSYTTKPSTTKPSATKPSTKSTTKWQKPTTKSSIYPSWAGSWAGAPPPAYKFTNDQKARKTQILSPPLGNNQNDLKTPVKWPSPPPSSPKMIHTKTEGKNFPDYNNPELKTEHAVILLWSTPYKAGWSKVPVALPVLIPVPVLFSASAASAAKFHTEKALVLA